MSTVSGLDRTGQTDRLILRPSVFELELVMVVVGNEGNLVGSTA
jgi:hypothetical protein